jgi:hypothetical protein
VGIESDQLVYDYLSRVGDVAHQRQLPSGTRMRLVSTLRNEIDRQRGKFGSDSPAAVRRIIGRMGSPDVVVSAASSGERADAAPPVLPEPAVPEQRTARGPRLAKETEDPDGQRIPRQGSSGPGAAPDWWRVELGKMDAESAVPGFVGGVEIPELLGRVPDESGKPVGDPDAAGAEQEEPPAERPGRRLRLRRRTGGEKAQERTGKPALANPFLLLAAVLLVAGAFLGSWLALAGGWLLAYASRRLSRTEAKWAVFGLPGVSAAGGLVWLWGRVDGRWGEAIPEGGMGEALSDLWPVVIRTAAVTSALFLVWRARKR